MDEMGVCGAKLLPGRSSLPAHQARLGVDIQTFQEVSVSELVSRHARFPESVLRAEFEAMAVLAIVLVVLIALGSFLFFALLGTEWMGKFF